MGLPLMLPFWLLRNGWKLFMHWRCFTGRGFCPKVAPPKPPTLFSLRCHTWLELTSATLSFSLCVTVSCCSVRNLFPVMRVEVDWGHSQQRERKRQSAKNADTEFFNLLFCSSRSNQTPWLQKTVFFEWMEWKKSKIKWGTLQGSQSHVRTRTWTS